MTYYEVLLPVPLGGMFTYSSDAPLDAGTRVRVSFGKRKLTGIIIKENLTPSSDYEIKPIDEVISDGFKLPNAFLDLIFKMSEYYFTAPGIVLSGILSSKILDTEHEPSEPKPHDEPEELTLNEEQKTVFERVYPHISDGYSSHLIHGVTGSGKTEVYVELAKEVIKNGKQVLYLVPEISLTPQLVTRINKRLGFEISTYHSKQTPKKRKEAFYSFATGESKFLIGARSALFVPASNIGLIIVDEEHESSYKQEEAPSYNTRDMAVLYSSMLKIPCLLGSATPSVESMSNAKSGKYYMHKLNNRHQAVLPQMELIDLKTADMINHIISEKLYDELFSTLARNEQAILFINRKGYSHTLYCRACGEVLNCANCSVALTYYKSAGYCSCSYCDTKYKRPKCGHCGSDDIIDYGAGTEKAAEIVEELFGEKVLRLDGDTVTSFKKLSEHLEDFKAGKYKIMTGTQIVAKGLHFPDVTLVGVLNIDNIFSIPDFRSAERAYQLIKQVSGRSGRSEKKGKVIIQTYSPDHPVFINIMGQKDEFYEYENTRRAALAYPPYGRLCRLIVSHTNEERVYGAIMHLSFILNKYKPALTILGPSKAPVYKVRNRFRYNILLKTTDMRALNEAIKECIYQFEQDKKGNMILKIDRDPQYFL